VAGSNPVTVTVPPGPFDLTQTQDAVNKALGVAPPNLGSAIVSLDGSNQLMIQSPTNQAIVLGSANGNTGLGNLFGTPGTGSGATFYDIVDVTSSQSLLTNSLAATPTFSQPFPSTPAGMRRFSPGQPINLSGLAGPTANYGVSVTISGDPANGDAFKVKPSSSQSVFKTVANLIETLERTASGDPATSAQYSNDIGFALTNLDQATENILRVRAAIGSRMGEIDSLSSVNEDLTLQYQQTLSQLQDLDYAKAITDLTRKQTDLQAAQQSFIRTSQLSLFNYL
jgi:flagellar hook-associated protein 3 FlgL